MPAAAAAASRASLDGAISKSSRSARTRSQPARFGTINYDLDKRGTMGKELDAEAGHMVAARRATFFRPPSPPKPPRSRGAAPRSATGLDPGGARVQREMRTKPSRPLKTGGKIGDKKPIKGIYESRECVPRVHVPPLPRGGPCPNLICPEHNLTDEIGAVLLRTYPPRPGPPCPGPPSLPPHPTHPPHPPHPHLSPPPPPPPFPSLSLSLSLFPVFQVPQAEVWVRPPGPWQDGAGHRRPHRLVHALVPRSRRLLRVLHRG
eukprot:SAG22_NODE_174_length_16466_cov_34.991568_5_plen_262_part_00